MKMILDDDQARALAEGLAHITQLMADANAHHERSTALLAQLRTPSESRTGPLDGILYTGTVTLDSNGRKCLDYALTFGRVAISCSSAITVLAANNSDPISAAPIDGPGVVQIGGAWILNEYVLAGRSLTLWGTAGTKVFLTVRVGDRA